MKKAKGKLKTVCSISSTPYFVTPVSHNDESYLEVISSSRLWFQVFWPYLNSYSYPINIVIMFCFNFKLQMPKMHKKWKKTGLVIFHPEHLNSGWILFLKLILRPNLGPCHLFLLDFCCSTPYRILC